MFDKAKMRHFFFGKSKTSFKKFKQYQSEFQKMLYFKNDSKSTRINFKKIILKKETEYTENNCCDGIKTLFSLAFVCNVAFFSLKYIFILI